MYIISINIIVFKVHNNLSVCCAHSGKTDADESAQVLTQKNWKMALLALDLQPAMNSHKLFS